MDGTFNYESSARYGQLCIKRLVDDLKKKFNLSYSIENVSEVRVSFDELTTEYESYKKIANEGFLRASEIVKSSATSSADGVKKIEDAIMADLENVKKIVLPCMAKAKTYIAEFDSQRANESMNASISSGSSHNEPNVKLPRINVPKFDGNIENFLEFHSLFQNLIHDEPSIPKVRKLYYLKDALIGDAAALVRDTPLTERGYDEAWCLVQSTYRDIKSITRKHFDQLFSIGRIKSHNEISALLANVNRALKGLRACGEETDNWSTILSYLVSERLDEVTYTEFEKTLTTNTKFPPWNKLKTFLENRSSITKRKGDQTKSNTQRDTVPKRTVLTTATNTESKPVVANNNTLTPSKPVCCCCNEHHFLIDCTVFLSKSPKQRYDIVKSKSLCVNCFHSNHKTNDCKKPPKCKKCSNRHHSLLHFDDNATSKISTTTAPTDFKNATTSTSTCGVSVSRSKSRDSDTKASLLSVRKPVCLLPTALVKFKCGKKCGTMRVLLDSCSQLNLISNSFVSKYNLPCTEALKTSVVGIGSTETYCNRYVNLKIESRIEDFEIDVRCNVIDQLPYSINDLFVNDFSAKVNQNNLNLADTAYYDRYVNIVNVDAVLGIVAYDQCVRGDVVQIESACLRDTTLGWTVSSIIDQGQCQKPKKPYVGLTVDHIDRRLEQFWRIEDIPTEPDTDTEQSLCNEHFERTYQRNPDGQFVVRLPFKSDPNVITNNLPNASRYLKRVISRLDESTKGMYVDFMNEYQELKHMSVVCDEIPRYYIPHHAVLRPSSTTTKLRVVFHASSKADGGVSLNDTLMVGPSLQPELFDTMLRFRTYRYTITGDIEKMYRCILVHENDRRFQSIIWENRKFELNTVTYGTVPASFIATKCLEVISEEIKDTEPIAAAAIKRDFYMDDFISGADTVSEVVRLQVTVHRTLLSAGFKLRKYQSNSPLVLKQIDPALIETNLTKQFGENESLSILGLSWCPTRDEFTLKSDIPVPSNTITKRQMLSTISKIFDPLGLASPVTIRGKLIFQRLWKLGISWDDPVPTDIDKEFRSYLSDLTRLSQFHVPRYIHEFNASLETLVGFCDASEQAYCAAVYAFNDAITPHRLQLLCSKTRVAPVKQLKIPELELQAAVLLVQLVNRVRKIIDVQRVRLFTDSMIVLAWLSRSPNEWKTFVRNRVSKISASFPVSHWSHVRSAENPADLATRGISTNSLIKSDLWSTGPNVLTGNRTASSEITIDNVDYQSYLSKPKTVSCLSIEEQHDSKFIESCSSYEKLRRVYATVSASVRTWKSKSYKRNPILCEINTEDFVRAEQLLIRLAQASTFREDIDRVRNERKLRKRSCLRRHAPFLDECGILRSRTRLQNARKPMNEKKPIILHAQHHFTLIYIRHLHEKFFHANRQWLLTHLSANYVFVGGIQRLIKTIVQKCVSCIDHFVKAKPQEMGDLPYDRVTPSPPFHVTGIDFTGAFQLKCTYHRTVKYMKAYAYIFVCLSTRAVHIELVPSLSTEDFLNAFKQFISRRGIPTTVYSDNGTNFVGGERYLNLQDPIIDNFVKSNAINWKFNPPYTPHRGGIWESAVKSAKKFIPIVTKNQTLTENELRTLLTQIESILNSRPLAYSQTSEPVEEILTPGHFLIGRNLAVLPEPITLPTTIKLSAQYRANYQRVRNFWQIWSQDYLNQLRLRTKWVDRQPNLSVGQIVLLKIPNAEPGRWHRAIITRTLPDKNNVVRTVEVRTATGQLKIIPSIHAVPLPTE